MVQAQSINAVQVVVQAMPATNSASFWLAISRPPAAAHRTPRWATRRAGWPQSATFDWRSAAGALAVSPAGSRAAARFLIAWQSLFSQGRDLRRLPSHEPQVTTSGGEQRGAERRHTDRKTGKGANPEPPLDQPLATAADDVARDPQPHRLAFVQIFERNPQLVHHRIPLLRPAHATTNRRSDRARSNPSRPG